MRFPQVTAAGTAACLLAVNLCAGAAPALERAFAFGCYNVVCPTANVPAVSYTMVLQSGNDLATSDFLAYDPARGWGYVVLFPDDLGNNGYNRFAGASAWGVIFDNTPNNRNVIPDVAGEPLTQLYDSFIGAKNFAATCSAAVVGDYVTPCAEAGIAPQGILFRVDVPNGKYRFVAVSGSPDYRHASRILVEDGGEDAPPDRIGDHVVLVSNYDIAQVCPPGTPAGRPYPYARAAFGCYVPPAHPAVIFINMDEDGLRTDGPPASPTLTVTQGHIRVHQLQANSNDGPCGIRDPNGGDLIILEVWNVGDAIIPPGVFAADVRRTIDPPLHEPDATIAVTLASLGGADPVKVEETIPAGYGVVDRGGGTLAGSVLTFNLAAGAAATYTIRPATGFIGSGIIAGVVSAPGACETPSLIGDAVVNCAGALSPAGGVREMLIIGPVDLGVEAGAACDDNGNLAATDYFTDGSITESTVLAKEGDSIAPAFGGAAGGVAVETVNVGNTAINPGAAAGILTVWTAAADADGMVDFNAAENLAPTADIVDFVIYGVVYLENTTAACKDVVLVVGSDDAQKTLVNGELAHVSAVCRSIGAEGTGDLIPATLFPGNNVVAIAVVERAGSTQVRLIVRNPDGTAVGDGSVRYSLRPPAAYPSIPPFTVVRTIDPARIMPGGTVAVTLVVADLTGPISVVETFPAEYAVAGAGGGTVDAARHTITFAATAGGAITYTLRAPASFADCPCGAAAFDGTASASDGCAGKIVSGDATVTCEMPAPECPEPPDAPAYELVAAFAFGTHPDLPAGDWCASHNDAAFPFTPVEQLDGRPASIGYTEERGFGYEALYPAYAWDAQTPYGNRAGWEIYGPIDESPNDRAVAFGPDCAEALYDSCIGAKNFLGVCDATVVGNPIDPCPNPEGIIFRVDVPGGDYRFVLASGDAENPHSHRILAEDGGSGPPETIGAHVVLVAGLDQGQYGIGLTDPARPGEAVYARVGFGDRIPPPADGSAPDPVFVNMDEHGLPTAGCADSPALAVSSGYVRIHQLQFQQNAGCGGLDSARAGGDLVVLELWRKADGGTESVYVLMGNVNTDGKVDIADAIALLGYLFGGGTKPPPVCAKAADANDDNRLDIADAIKILGYLFSQQPMLAPDHRTITAANNTCTAYPADGNDGTPFFPAEVGKLPPCETQCR